MTKRQKTVAKILELKEFNKEQLEAEVRKANDRLRDEQETLAVLNKAYAATNGGLTARQSKGTIPVHEVELFTTYLKHVHKQIELQTQVINVRSAELDALQSAMVEAYKEQRVFEILQDKIAQEATKEAAQVEQKTADYNYLSGKAER